MIVPVAPQISNEAAIDEAVALARELGLSGALAPAVLADRSNLVVHLAPHPSCGASAGIVAGIVAGIDAGIVAGIDAGIDAGIVARIAMATSTVRVGMAWLRREVEISRVLDARGIAVTRPATRIEAGPFERAGLVISFWELERLEGSLDPQLAGARLAGAHRALRDVELALPEWGGWSEARVALERARASGAWSETERSRVERAWERAERVIESARARSASFQPVHGDAHVRNVLASSRGPVWTDWEDAFVGPVEWDLACLRSRLELFGEERETIETMTRGYDAPWNEELARDLGLARNLQVIPWLAVYAEREPELSQRMRARIEQLPR